MLVKISEAAKELDVCSEHVRRMIRRGFWPAYKLSPKVTRVDLDEIKAAAKLTPNTPVNK